jgi:archaellum component FlaC
MKPQALLLLLFGLAISNLGQVNPAQAKAKTTTATVTKTIPKIQDCDIKPSLDDEIVPPAACDRIKQEGKTTDILDDIEDVNKRVDKVTGTIKKTTDTINNGKKTLGDFLKSIGIGILN